VTERWSIGAVNPALTAMANAIRVGEHITGRNGAEAGVEARFIRTSHIDPSSNPGRETGVVIN